MDDKKRFQALEKKIVAYDAITSEDLKGIDIKFLKEQKNSKGQTLVHVAAYYGNSQALKAIVEGCDHANKEFKNLIDAQDNNGNTALHSALYRDQQINMI